MNQKNFSNKFITYNFATVKVALNRERVLNIFAFVCEDKDRLNIYLPGQDFQPFLPLLIHFLIKFQVSMQTKGEFVSSFVKGWLYNWLGNSNVKQCFGTCSQFF